MQGTSITFASHPLTERIGTTLSAINTDFANVEARNDVYFYEAIGAVDSIRGLQVSLGTFPSVNITAGTIVTPLGNVFDYEATSLALTPVAGSIVSIYLDENYDFASGTTVADGAKFLLARVIFNSAGTAFSQLLPGTIEETRLYGDDGELLAVTVTNGPVRLLVAAYAYNANLQPILMQSETPYKVELESISYNGSGLITSTKMEDVRNLLSLPGGTDLDTLLDEVADFSLRLLTYDGLRTYDGSEIYNGTA